VRQTYRDFEWIVVDDGSTDDTRRLIAQWEREADFPIRYVHQQNAGKSAACNSAVALARGELFLTLDSDDGCVPTALERLLHHWLSIEEADRDGFSAVTALCMNESGHIVGTPFPRDPTDSNSIEIRYRYRVTGEKWGFQRTAVMRRFPFPTVQGPGGTVPEGVVWHAIARSYQTRYVNEPLRIYHVQDTDWSSYSRSRSVLSPAKARLVYQSSLNSASRYVAYAPLALLRDAAHYSRMSLLAGIGPVKQLQGLDNRIARGLLVIAFPIGFAAALRDRIAQS
jgi:glycosyltransferase involved in cell wall biosynthesis